MLISRSVTGNMMIVLYFTKCNELLTFLELQYYCYFWNSYWYCSAKKGRMETWLSSIMSLLFWIDVLQCLFHCCYVKIFYAYIYWLVFAGAASSRKNWGPTHNYLPLQAPLTVLVFGKILELDKDLILKRKLNSLLWAHSELILFWQSSLSS